MDEPDKFWNPLVGSVCPGLTPGVMWQLDLSQYLGIYEMVERRRG